jgi:hypothetical protein
MTDGKRADMFSRAAQLIARHGLFAGDTRKSKPCA